MVYSGYLLSVDELSKGDIVLDGFGYKKLSKTAYTVDDIDTLNFYVIEGLCNVECRVPNMFKYKKARVLKRLSAREIKDLLIEK